MPAHPGDPADPGAAVCQREDLHQPSRRRKAAFHQPQLRADPPVHRRAFQRTHHAGHPGPDGAHQQIPSGAHLPEGIRHHPHQLPDRAALGGEPLHAEEHQLFRLTDRVAAGVLLVQLFFAVLPPQGAHVPFPIPRDVRPQGGLKPACWKKRRKISHTVRQKKGEIRKNGAYPPRNSAGMAPFSVCFGRKPPVTGFGHPSCRGWQKGQKSTLQQRKSDRQEYRSPILEGVDTLDAPFSYLI